MKNSLDKFRDITEIRSMEYSSKCLSLPGLAYSIIGMYAFSGIYFTRRFCYFNPNEIMDNAMPGSLSYNLLMVISLAWASIIIPGFRPPG